MKSVNKICRILSVVFGLASLVLFFTNFVNITTADFSKDIVGAQLAFGSKVEGIGDMARSADILLCFCLTAISAVLSIFSFKSKSLRYAVPGIGIITTIYMLVILLSVPYAFVDIRPLAYDDVQRMTYSVFVILAVVALALFTIASVAYLLIDDYLEVLESKGEKLPILKRVVRFFRDYKSEYKKIVWPNYKDVAKNTFIVLVMCLLIGALIWIVDFGLGQLLSLILGK